MTHGLDDEGSGLTPGSRGALDELFSLAYEELRRLAATIHRGDASMTVNPTALVNEAWLKLAACPSLGAVSPIHFKRIAARAMRQVLVEAARRRNAHKRGGGAAMVEFDEALGQRPTGSSQLLALDAALKELGRLNPRQATMVECRYFGGLGVTETADLLQVSEATVLRDWRAVKAWLGQELRRE